MVQVVHMLWYGDMKAVPGSIKGHGVRKQQNLLLEIRIILRAQCNLAKDQCLQTKGIFQGME